MPIQADDRSGGVGASSTTADVGVADHPQPEPVATWRDRPRWRRVGAVAGIGGPMLVGLGHVWAVAPHYHFGSFDDDAGYVLAAKAILHGAGLTGLMANGRPLVGYYPPGFSALLAPVIGVLGPSVTALRLFAAVFYAAIFPATWWYLARCRVGRPTRTAVLAVLALNPVLATFGSMVMAETVFVALFMAWLVLARRYDKSPDAWRLEALGVIVLGAGLIWVKQAALGMVIGLVLWFAVRRMWRKALAVAAGVGALMAPLLIARLVVGVPLGGARYSEEIGEYYSGGLWHRVTGTFPRVWDLLTHWVTWSLVPAGSPFPVAGWEFRCFELTGWAAAVLVVVGAVAWCRHFRDPSVGILAVYLGEALAFPFVNERRTVLFLPVLAMWFVLGGITTGRWLQARWLRWAPGTAATARAGGTVLASVAVAGAVVFPLARQFPRDYLLGLGQSTSQPDGSPYMDMLRALGTPADVVETDYLFTVALLSGHRSANTAFIDTNGEIPGAAHSCNQAEELGALHADGAAFLLTGDLNHPGSLDSDCLLTMAADSPWAVRLLTTSVDNASVFELIGPGTPHPGLVNLTTQATLRAPELGATPLGPQGPFDTPGNILTSPASGGRAVLTWTWPSPVAVTQVSLGAAALASTTGVQLQEQRTGGQWVTVAAAAGAVGDHGRVPFLLATSPQGARISALRVVVEGTGTAGIDDVVALGPGSPRPG